MLNRNWKIFLLLCLILGIVTAGVILFFQPFGIDELNEKEKARLDEEKEIKEWNEKMDFWFRERSIELGKLEDLLRQEEREIEFLDAKELQFERSKQDFTDEIQELAKQFERERQEDLAILTVYQEAYLKHLGALLSGNIPFDPDNSDTAKRKGEFDKVKCASLKEAWEKQREGFEKREKTRNELLRQKTQDLVKDSQKLRSVRRELELDREIRESYFRLLKSRIYKFKLELTVKTPLLFEQEKQSDRMQQNMETILDQLDQLRKEVKELRKK